MKDLHTLDKYRDRETERRCYGRNGDGGNGVFKVYVGKRSFFVIASSDLGWEHVSVSPCNAKRKTCPTWEEMCAIKDMFFGEEERVTRPRASTSTSIPTASTYGGRKKNGFRIPLNCLCEEAYRDQRRQNPNHERSGAGRVFGVSTS